MRKENTCHYVLLGILSLGPSTGYEIKKKIESEIGYFYRISNGQIYPGLNKLLGENFATCSQNRCNGRSRITYTITDKGLRAFGEWMAAPIDLRVNNEDLLLLKLYFGSVAPISNSIALMSGFQNTKEENLQAYNNIATYFNLSSIRTLPEYYSYFTLRFGQIVAQAYLNWSNEVLGVLKDLEDKDASNREGEKQ